MTRIKTDRLLLRPMQTSDLDDLHQVFSNPDVMKYWSTLPHPDPSHTAALIKETIGANPETSAEFAIEFEGRVIGKAGFWRMPEVGYLLHPDFWRRGFGREALGALIDYGFQQRGMNRITADVDPKNAASICLLEGFGFAETHRASKTVQIDGIWYDSIYFALDRANWAAMNPQAEALIPPQEDDA